MLSRHRFVLFAIIFFAGLALSLSRINAQENKNVHFDIVDVTVGNIKTEAQLANTPETRAHGLMYAQSAEPGMLLIYPRKKVMNLWMRNTYVPLDVAFFKKNGTIIKISQMQPLSDDVHSSGRKVIGGLEMPLGWYSKNQIKVGDKITYTKK